MGTKNEPSGWITQSRAAELVNRNTSTIQSAVKSGKLKKNSRGQVYYPQVRERYKLLDLESGKEKNITVADLKIRDQEEENEKLESEIDDIETDSMIQIKLKHETYKAELAKLKVSEQKGLLKEAAVVDTHFFEAARSFKKAALQLVSLAPQLSVETDILNCKILIENAINKMLSNLSKKYEALADE